MLQLHSINSNSHINNKRENRRAWFCYIFSIVTLNTFEMASVISQSIYYGISVEEIIWTQLTLLDMLELCVTSTICTSCCLLLYNIYIFHHKFNFKVSCDHLQLLAFLLCKFNVDKCNFGSWKELLFDREEIWCTSYEPQTRSFD